MKKIVILLLVILGILFIACNELDKESASKLAAELANKEFLKLFENKPFNSSDYEAKFVDGYWKWGGRDQTIGDGGYSAEVSFKKDGSERRVKIYFQTDKLDLWKEKEIDIEMEELKKKLEK